MGDCGFISVLESRRSVRPTMFSDLGPTSDELERIVRVALRAPDHKKLAPWRFVVFQGGSRAQFGEVMAAACVAEEDGDRPSEVRLKTERERFMRAPVVVAVVSQIRLKPGVPEWEQILSAGASAFSLRLAANALGYATCWLTEWVAYSPGVRRALGLADGERIAGFVYMGRPNERQEDRERPKLEDKLSYWSAN